MYFKRNSQRIIPNKNINKKNQQVNILFVYFSLGNWTPIYFSRVSSLPQAPMSIMNEWIYNIGENIYNHVYINYAEVVLCCVGMK